MNTTTSNKGRITNPAQAWDVAHREYFDRTRIANIDEAHDDALREQSTEDACEYLANPAEPLPGSDVVAFTPAPLVSIPIKFLQAALLTAGKGDIRYYLNGVYLHGIDSEFRLCATDGHRLVVSRFEIPQDEKMPEWAEAGLIIPRDELAQALPILTKNAIQFSHDCSEPVALLDYTAGAPSFTLRTVNGFASFVMRPVDGKFPDYAKVLASSATTLARGDNEAMQTSAINTEYLKGAADVASKLGAKAVHAFINGSDKTATFFTFEGAPDTCLIVMPMRAGPAVSDGVVKLIGREGINASLAAFRAHVTRAAKALTSATTEKDRAEIEDRKAALEAKIAHLVAVTTSSPKQIEHRAAA